MPFWLIKYRKKCRFFFFIVLPHASKSELGKFSGLHRFYWSFYQKIYNEMQTNSCNKSIRKIFVLGFEPVESIKSHLWKLLATKQITKYRHEESIKKYPKLPSSFFRCYLISKQLIFKQFRSQTKYSFRDFNCNYLVLGISSCFAHWRLSGSDNPN